jgi:hypothetical protein
MITENHGGMILTGKAEHDYRESRWNDIDRESQT